MAKENRRVLHVKEYQKKYNIKKYSEALKLAKESYRKKHPDKCSKK